MLIQAEYQTIAAAATREPSSLPEGKPADYDGDNLYIRDGIVVVPKNAVIQFGVWI